MLTLYITRHGQTEWNVQSRMQGWADSPLTVTGVEAATQLGKRLQNVPLDASQEEWCPSASEWTNTQLEWTETQVEWTITHYEWTIAQPPSSNM